MRVAVMSDIHGYSLALDVVMQDILDQGPFDAVVVAGDLCEVGPDPAGVIERLRATDWFVLQGNTDFDIALAADGIHESEELDFVLREIGAEGADWLRRLPRTIRLSPPDGRSVDDDLLVCHANPQNLYDRIEPDLSDKELRHVLGETRAGAIAFGHYHVTFSRRLGDLLLVDVSAVGNPKDEDLRCKYAILLWDGNAKQWTAEHRRLPYPLEATRRQILESGLPDPKRTVSRLERASYRKG
jgi:predicted phosphodiesterase